MQAHPSGHNGVVPCFTQYCGTEYAATPLAAGTTSFPQTSSEHRVNVPYRSFAVASLRQLHPSGQAGVVVVGSL
jgi:hypothetical protein